MSNGFSHYTRKTSDNAVNWCFRMDYRWLNTTPYQAHQIFMSLLWFYHRKTSIFNEWKATRVIEFQKYLPLLDNGTCVRSYQSERKKYQLRARPMITHSVRERKYLKIARNNGNGQKKISGRKIGQTAYRVAIQSVAGIVLCFVCPDLYF